MSKVYVNATAGENTESMSVNSWRNTDIGTWEFPSEEEAKSFFQASLEEAKKFYTFVEVSGDGYTAYN